MANIAVAQTQMSLAVIIPWGTDHGHREHVWNTLCAEWEATGLTLIIAADPLFNTLMVDGADGCDSPLPVHPFSVARAINHAAGLAPPELDRFVFWGADHLPDPEAIAWADLQLDKPDVEWTFLYDSSAMLNEDDTERYLTGEPVEWVTQTTNTIMPGLIAIHRATFERVGGFDERYEGWAYEDCDLMNRLYRTIHPHPGPFYPGPLRGLWHSGEHRELSIANPNVRLFHAAWG